MISRGDARLVTWRNLARSAAARVSPSSPSSSSSSGPPNPSAGSDSAATAPTASRTSIPSSNASGTPTRAREPLPPRCERELAGALRLDRLQGTLARSRLYGALAAGVAERGLTAFDPAHANDAQTQGLSLSSLFTFDPTTGEASPVLRRLDVPVRAVVFPVPPRSAAARGVFLETRPRALARISTHGRRARRG